MGFWGLCGSTPTSTRTGVSAARQQPPPSDAAPRHTWGPRYEQPAARSPAVTAQHTRLRPLSAPPMEPPSAPPLEPPASPPLEPARARVAAGTPRRQSAPALAPPPDDREKYSYIGRNLPYLTTGLVVSAACLVISQLRFEAPSPALWPFMAVTVTYLIYQVISLPVNFTGRGFDVAAHRARVGAWRPEVYP